MTGRAHPLAAQAARHASRSIRVRCERAAMPGMSRRLPPICCHTAFRITFAWRIACSRASSSCQGLTVYARSGTPSPAAGSSTEEPCMPRHHSRVMHMCPFPVVYALGGTRSPATGFSTGKTMHASPPRAPAHAPVASSFSLRHPDAIMALEGRGNRPLGPTDPCRIVPDHGGDARCRQSARRSRNCA